MVATLLRATFAMMIALHAPASPAACPYDDSLWRDRKPAERRLLLDNPEPAVMTDSCLVAFMKIRLHSGDPQSAAGAGVAALADYCARSFSLALLARIAPLFGAGDGAREVAGLWEKHNGRFRQSIERRDAAGEYQSLDSLFAAFHTLGICDVFDLVRWTGVKMLLGDVPAAGRIFCDIVNTDPGLIPLVQSRFDYALTDATPAQRATALAACRECAAALADRSSRDSMLGWLALVYGRCGFDREEYSIASTQISDSCIAGRVLGEIAQRHYAQNRPRQVVDPAARAWRICSESQHRSWCAILLAHSYTQLGNRDSTALWLKRMNLNDPRSAMGAVSLFQQAGLTGAADSIIRMLPPSVQRDTLAIRNLLFSNKAREARAYIRACLSSTSWLASPSDISLWRVRGALFDADMASTAAWLDSAKIAPEWEYAQELLQQKYALSLMQMDSDAFSLWSRLCLAIYTNKLQPCIDSLSAIRHLLPAVQEHYIATLAGKLLDNGQPRDAATALHALPDSGATPRILFYRAEVARMQGEVAAAQKLFDQLILRYPQDVFSNRARMALMRMSSQP
jgi:tetratricopeptide (TPR) repeat protein